MDEIKPNYVDLLSTSWTYVQCYSMKYHGIHDLLKSFKCCITLLIYHTGFRFRKEFHDKIKSQRSGLRVHLLRHNEDSLCFENE